MQRSRERDVDVVTRLALERRRHLRNGESGFALVVEGHVHERFGAEILDGPDVRCQRALPDAHGLGTETHHDPIATEGGQARRHGGVDVEGATPDADRLARGAAEQVHRRRPDEPGHEQVRRFVVKGVRRVALLEHSVAKDGDAVAHRHRFDLVMGDVHRRHRQPRLELGELGSGLHPQLGVQVRERLVHQVHLRLANDRPAHGDALALAAREGLRLAIEEGLEIEHARHLAHPCRPLLLGNLVLLEGEAHVLCDRQLRVQGVVLEDHGDVPVAGPNAAHIAIADEDRPLIERLEAGKQAQRSGLARARRPDEHHQLAVVDLQIQVRHGRLVGAGVEPCRRRELDRCHAASYLIAPMERPRIMRFCANQPASTTGTQASTDAADSLARKLPRVLMFVVTQIGIVEPLAGLSWTA